MLDLTGYTLTFDEEFNRRDIAQTAGATTWGDIRSQFRGDINADVGFGASSFVDAASGYDPFRVTGGVLTITAVPDHTSYGVPTSWESGLITTQGSFSQTYGYFEIRADFSNQPGAWDAFWLLPDTQLPDPNKAGRWQELDIVEHYGSWDKGVYSGIHTTDSAPNEHWQRYLQVYSEIQKPSGYHTYGMNWQADRISFYVDGQLVGSQVTPSDLHGPMYLLANLATQRDAANNADAAGVPISSSIDYIRVYSNAPGAVAVALDTISSPDGRDPGLYGARTAPSITVPGERGNNTYIVDHAADSVIEASGGGFDEVKASVSYTLAAGQEIESLTTTNAAGKTAINLTGNEFAQTITGNAGGNVLRGGGGADVLNGLGGLDTADYSDKTVAVEVALNKARIVTVKVGGVAEDRIVNIENVTGGAAADKLTGDGGANILNGGKGADTLTGLAGNDTYVIDVAGDRVIEAKGGGSDTVRASVSYTLAAGQEIETLITTDAAGKTAINLTGNAFGQAITGNAGINILTGGAGADRLTGGLGRDTFDFNAKTDSGTTAATRDVILDFKQGEDRIDLSTIDANGALAGDAFTFLTKAGSAFTGKAGQLTFTIENPTGTANDRTIIQADLDGNKIADFQIELKGLHTLTSADFIL